MNDSAKVCIHTIICIAAAIALVVGYWDPFSLQPTWWWGLIPKIGEIIIVGGIIGYISNKSTILDSYRKELIDIIYESRYLKNRKDIDTIWTNVSKEMFRSKFPKIHNDLLSTIQRYLPSNEVNYYDNYVVTTRVKLCEDGRIEVVDDSEFVLVAESEDKFEFSQDNWVHKDAELNIELKVDGVNVLPQQIKTSSQQNNDQKHYVSKIDLKGKLRYRVEKKVKRCFYLKDDNYLAFRSKYITNGFAVTFVLPDELRLEFTERGTQSDFRERRISDNTIEYKYQGLILPRQGYVAILQYKDMLNNKILTDEKEHGKIA